MVSVPDHNKAGSFKDIFRLENVIDDCVDFDFRSVVKGLRCLYPDGAIISFRLLP